MNSTLTEYVERIAEENTVNDSNGQPLVALYEEWIRQTGLKDTHARSVAFTQGARAAALQADDAVTELVSEFRQFIQDCDDSGVTTYSKGKGFDESIERARAALARVSTLSSTKAGEG